jgi:predicted transcriptional regulator
MRRHLRSKYNMTPEQYREKWGLPSDYPMVAPNYSITRTKLAKQIGLGKRVQRKRKTDAKGGGVIGDGPLPL